jgi:phasin family protein
VHCGNKKTTFLLQRNKTLANLGKRSIIRIMLQRSKQAKPLSHKPKSRTQHTLHTTLRSTKMLTAEQMIAAQKAHMETLFGLTQKAFSGVEKLMELNVEATKAALTDSQKNTTALLSAKDAQELLTLQATLMQPLVEKAASYSRQLYEIASGTGTDFVKASEEQAAEAQQKFMAVVDNVAKNAPAGSEQAVAAMKNAVAAATTAMETVQRAVKQATELAESNMQALSSQALSATKTATKKR